MTIKIIHRIELGTNTLLMRWNPAACIILICIFRGPHDKLASNFDKVLTTYILQRLMAICVNEFDQFLNDRCFINTLDLIIGMNVIHAIVRNLERCSEMIRHDVRSFGHAHFGIHCQLIMKVCLVLSRTDFKCTCIFIFGIKFKQCRIHIQTEMGAFKGFLLAVVIDSIPCTWMSLERSLSGTAKVNQACFCGYRPFNAFVNLIVPFVRFGIPVFAAVDVTTSNKKVFWLVESTTSFLVNEDGGDIGVGFKEVNEALTVTEHTHVGTRVNIEERHG